MTGLMVSMLAFVAGVKDKLASEKGATATEYGCSLVSSPSSSSAELPLSAAH